MADLLPYSGHSIKIAGGRVSVSTYPLQMPSRNKCRSSVNSFSMESRRRFLDQLSRLPWPTEEVEMFTLTFAEAEVDGKFAKGCLDGLHRWFSRNYPGSEVAWKLEYQRRGSPHFHLLVRPTPGSAIDPGVFPRVVSAWERLGGGRIAHESQSSGSRRGVINYMANYLAKKSGDKAYQEQVPEGAWSGRFWGFWGHPELLPEYRESIDYDEFVFMVDVINNYLSEQAVEFRFRTFKASSRYDPPLAYLIRALLLGESVNDAELGVMTPEELAEWNRLVDSGVLFEIADRYDRELEASKSVRASG